MTELRIQESNPTGPLIRERPVVKIYDRPASPMPWLTPVVVPALLLLLVASVLIYLIIV
jgi:hypothetical protein